MFYRQDSDLEGAKVFLRNRMERKESVIFVAVEDGEYIGFTQLYPSFSSISMKELWILNDLFVQAAKRGQEQGKIIRSCERIRLRKWCKRCKITNRD